MGSQWRTRRLTLSTLFSFFSSVSQLFLDPFLRKSNTTFTISHLCLQINYEKSSHARIQGKPRSNARVEPSMLPYQRLSGELETGLLVINFLHVYVLCHTIMYISTQWHLIGLYRVYDAQRPKKQNTIYGSLNVQYVTTYIPGLDFIKID